MTGKGVRRFGGAVDLAALVVVAFVAVAVVPGEALAQAVAPVGDVAPQTGAPQMLRPYDFIFGSVQFFLVGLFILWMLYLRPLQRREDSQRKFLAALKKNDDVVTSGGIFGKVMTVKPDEVTIEVSSGVKLRIKPDHLYPIVTTPRDSKASPLQIAGK